MNTIKRIGNKIKNPYCLFKPKSMLFLVSSALPQKLRLVYQHMGSLLGGHRDMGIVLPAIYTGEKTACLFPGKDTSPAAPPFGWEVWGVHSH